MNSIYRFKYITLIAVALCATACSYENHFLDEEEPAPESHNTLWNVNVSGYAWTYINLKTGKTETHPDTGEWIYAGTGEIRPTQPDAEISIEWHIAVHRYEFKTNGASVFNTRKTDISTLTELPSGTYKFDEVAPYETEKEKKKENGRYLLSMDMAGMMTNNIGYAHNPAINRVLCDAITRTHTGGMPPVLYETKKEVLVLKFNDGSWIKLQIAGTQNIISGVSNYMSFNYKHYPAE